VEEIDSYFKSELLAIDKMYSQMSSKIQDQSKLLKVEKGGEDSDDFGFKELLQINEELMSLEINLDSFGDLETHQAKVEQVIQAIKQSAPQVLICDEDQVNVECLRL